MPPSEEYKNKIANWINKMNFINILGLKKS